MIRFLAGVDAQVTLERLQVAEARVTHGAAVRFLAGVDQHVSTQVRHLTDLKQVTVSELELNVA